MDIKFFDFHKKTDSRGKLVFFEIGKDIPFAVKRIYYLYDTEEGESRGYHSHKKLEQCLICINGSVKITLDTAEEKSTILLDDNTKGLYVGNNIWRQMHDFSHDAVLLVLASEYYDEEDYIRDYDNFLKWTNENKKTTT